MKWLPPWVFLFTLCGALPSSAQPALEQVPPRHRLVYRAGAALRGNPSGLSLDGRLSYRLRLYESGAPALRDNFAAVGLAPFMAPSLAKLGPVLELQPLTVLNLWAALQGVQYFGTFGALQGFPSASSDFGEAALQAGASRRVPATGWELTLGATLQLRLGSWVLRDGGRLVRGSYGLRAGDSVYYDTVFDVAAPNGGWLATHDVDVLWQGMEGRLLAGARYTATVPFYGEAQLDPAAPPPDNALQRVGPFAAYTFSRRDGGPFNAPTVFLLVQWWVQHRYRAGAESPQWLPMVGAGFQCSGDLLPFD